ncbi:MAG: NAD(P)-dependent oxidoreductase [Anaerolineae bacterium]|nr:NAD(P)-dependent oxidoreductase [Anaerolineae bacterium]
MDMLITSEEDLDLRLSEPTPGVLAALRGLDSDLLILGVGGKMGPTLARMAARALRDIGSPYTVYGISRFSQPVQREQLEAWGVQTVACDLLDRRAVAALPDSLNLIYMVGQKFGTGADPALTWAINTYVPALVAERYSSARVVVFSTGNVYPLTPVVAGGSQEGDDLGPQGDYAHSCVGRERVFTYFSQRTGLRCALMRLNYAIALRYGVLVDIARRVWVREPVDVTMGAFNAIWQGDANAQALALLSHCAVPPFVLNVTGPETISVRRVAERFGELFNIPVTFTGIETPTALLSNAAKSQYLFGYPGITLPQMIAWTASWVQQGGSFLDKPTHFEARDGKY